MKNFAYCLLFLACVFGFSSCRVNVKTNVRKGARTKVTCNVSDFERINVGAMCDVWFCQDDSTRVEIEGRQKDLDRLSVRVKGETLYIGYNEKKTGMKNLDFGGYNNVKVRVYSPDLIALDMKAGGNFESEYLLDTDTLDVRLWGAGNVEFDKVECDILRLHMQGAGNVEFDKLTAQHSDIRLHGVGNVEVDFENSGTANCRLDGVGNIELKGTLKHLKKEIHGVGRIETDRLITK